MNLRRLTQYVNQRNVFATTKMDLNALTNANCQDLLNSLYINLSPENLSCDGEVRGAELRSRAQYFVGAVNELKAYAKNKGFYLDHSLAEFNI